MNLHAPALLLILSLAGAPASPAAQKPATQKPAPPPASTAPAQAGSPERARLESYERALAQYPRNPYWQFAAVQTARRLGAPEPGPASARADASRWRPGLYETTTGAAAIQESLQLDRLAGAGDTSSASTVPLSTVQGIDTPSIPFEKLLEGRVPVVEPIARCAPADWYYAHFASVSAMRRVLDASDQWGGHLLAAYALSGRDARLREKLERQLLLASTPALDPFYDLVVGDVAVVGSDPFLLEGSDVTVVFALRNATLFAARLELGRHDAASGEGAGAKLSIVHDEYRGWQIDGVASADRSVSSYTGIHGDLAAVSTSLAALRAVVDAASGASPAMASSPDFRYMRSVYPYGSGEEDAFLFLSDAFVRRVVSPRLKIGEARRMRCAASLQTAAYASMLFRGEQGRAPASLDELVTGKFLDRASLRCPDGGTYALEDGVPVCSVHNRLRRLTPNLELKLDAVSPEEASSYADYREQYKSYWRRYVDPIGIRARVGAGVSLQATVLPLVDSSVYRDVASFAGGVPIGFARPQLPNAVATFDFKLKAKAGEERGVDQALGEAKLDPFVAALGEWASVQVVDSNPILVPELASDFGRSTPGSLRELAFLAPALVGLVMPTVAIAPVEDRAALDRALAGLRRDVVHASDVFDPWVRVSGYALVEGGSRTVETVTLELFGFRLRVFYAVVGDRFVVATDRALIDAAAAAPLVDAGAGNLRFEVAPEQWKALGPSLALAYAEDARDACQENLGWIEALGSAFKAQPHELTAESLAYLGTAFACPDGGRYAVDASGRALCTAHGTKEAPRQGPRPQPGSPAAYVLERVHRVAAVLSFTKEGISAAVEVR